MDRFTKAWYHVGQEILHSTDLDEGLNHGQRKSKRLAAASARAADEVTARHHGLEHMLLDGEQRLDSALIQVHHSRV